MGVRSGIGRRTIVLEGVADRRTRTRRVGRKRRRDRKSANDFDSSFNSNTDNRKTTLVVSIDVDNSKSPVQPSFTSNLVPPPAHRSSLTSSFTQPSHPPNLRSHTRTLDPQSLEPPNPKPNPKHLSHKSKRSTTFGLSSTSGSLATRRLNLARRERR